MGEGQGEGVLRVGTQALRPDRGSARFRRLLWQFALADTHSDRSADASAYEYARTHPYANSCSGPA